MNDILRISSIVLGFLHIPESYRLVGIADEGPGYEKVY